ncbi:MAG: hypothetical protein IJN20_01065 [Oscillospiraceae bacterium]|nr:hypothetical protein [Oscillospiraceae bacterium]
MTKIYMKLIAMSLALILSVSVVLMSSYAWLVLSGNPAVTGIQVAIGGGNTILAAPNVAYEVEGKIYNIPGHFSNRMNFGQQKSYEYLQDLGKLNPVSTSNGIDWFLPEYYDGNDTEVQQGKIASGALKDVSEFYWDNELEYANLSKTKDQNKINKGNYIYLDFWVVAPGGDYFLRVSTGDDVEDGGSFVVDLLEAQESGNGYTLVQPHGSAAATVRVGFLANDVTLTDDTMLQYQASPYFDNRFTALRGLYVEPQSGAPYLDADRFTIYEPNADYHPEFPELNGSYVETKSLELVDKIAQERTRNRSDRDLTVQSRSVWAENGAALAEQFKTASFAILDKTMSAKEYTDYVYGKYLQGQIATFVDKGSFVKWTQELTGLLKNGAVAADEPNLEYAGATEDVYIIKLERNIPQRIRMFIWLEGQDIDCVDNVSSARFAVNIELAGGDK